MPQPSDGAIEIVQHPAILLYAPLRTAIFEDPEPCGLNQWPAQALVAAAVILGASPAGGVPGWPAAEADGGLAGAAALDASAALARARPRGDIAKIRTSAGRPR